MRRAAYQYTPEIDARLREIYANREYGAITLLAADTGINPGCLSSRARRIGCTGALNIRTHGPRPGNRTHRTTTPEPPVAAQSHTPYRGRSFGLPAWLTTPDPTVDACG
jgi:hypothetical protein